MFFSETKKLIVAYKDEMIVNQLKKLVETKDDTDEEKIVGTVDGSITIVSWCEKVWLDQKKAGNVNNKVLFIGDVKDTNKLVPLIDVKFEKYGVKYGWAGNQAVVAVEPKVLVDKKIYDEFLTELRKLPVPEMIKNDYYAEFKKKGNGFFDKTLNFMKRTAKELKNVFSSSAEVKRQMLFYGVIKMYNDHLEEFVNS